SVLFNLGDGKIEMESGPTLLAKNPGKYMLMGEDPRLPQMPEKPTLLDYFRCRFASTAHLLQSATHALKAGHDEKVILACLLHDVAVVSFIRCDNVVYSFAPTAKGNIDDFVDIMARNFRKPKEGLGVDNSRPARMWRTSMWSSWFL